MHVCELATGNIALAPGPTLLEGKALVERLMDPTGLAPDEDTLDVSSVATGTVLQVARDGEVLSTPAPVVEAGLAQREGTTARAGGRLVVEEGGTASTLATDPSFSPPRPRPLPFQLFNDLVVDDDDGLHINGDGAVVVYELGLTGAA
ncbi:MAG: hypothetical protein K0V04_34265 [Deltaproteobacteria bacterium]|nr:hypothetical protein [Deltaproteobacteria bacterium]